MTLDNGTPINHRKGWLDEQVLSLYVSMLDLAQSRQDNIDELEASKDAIVAWLANNQEWVRYAAGLFHHSPDSIRMVVGRIPDDYVRNHGPSTVGQWVRHRHLWDKARSIVARRDSAAA